MPTTSTLVNVASKEVSLTARFQMTTTPQTELKDRLVQATAILLAEDKIDPISIEEVFPDDDSSSFRGTYVIKLFCRCELMDVVVALQKVEEIRSVYPSPLRSAF